MMPKQSLQDSNAAVLVAAGFCSVTHETSVRQYRTFHKPGERLQVYIAGSEVREGPCFAASCPSEIIDMLVKREVRSLA